MTAAPQTSAATRPRPALLARHRDLTALRYDYPLVLTPGDGNAPPVQALSDIVDKLLQPLAAPGPDGERLRRHVLRLEQQIRTLAAAGLTGTLSELWQGATEALLAGVDAAARAALAESLECARRAISVDGKVLDCTERAPADFLTHLWRVAEAVRTRRFTERLHRLILRLRELLRTDFLETPEGRAPELLQRGFGAAYAKVFDFRVLSQTLDGAVRGCPLPERRRRRIRAALAVLETQRFAPAPATAVRAEAYAFRFENCRAALEALDQRLPEMAAVIRAMGIAELELDNRYREPLHDPFFERFDKNRLTPADLAWFPGYLVVVRDAGVPAERSAVLDALSAGLPLKILVQFDDIVEDLPLTGGKLAFGRKRPQFAGMALGLHSAFVLQSSSSHLYRMWRKIQRGLIIEGPALFCVYSGSGAGTVGLPPYLAAAAAVESRAFPLFTYDPTAGTDWASRFDVGDNPQPEAAWPVHRFEYEGRDHQRISERRRFTFADFAAADARYAAQLERIPANRPAEGLAAVADHLEQPSSPDATAFVPLVDDDHVLHRFAAGEELLQATRRCADAWRGLQELGGINNSHARRLLEQQKESQSLKARSEPVLQPPASRAPEGAPAAVGPAAVPAEPAAAPASDEPSIETPRCTTCDECTRLNNRMFVYNENKQAYIADINAGTYRELVEAAESCQVSIIHPGKPHNPGEPDLDELIRRAAPFQ